MASLPRVMKGLLRGLERMEGTAAETALAAGATEAAVIGGVEATRSTERGFSRISNEDGLTRMESILPIILILFASFFLVTFVGCLIAKRANTRRRYNQNNEQRGDQLMLLGNAAGANTGSNQLVVAMDQHDEAYRRNRFNLGIRLALLNLLLEIPTAVLEQIRSEAPKHSYILTVMLMSFTSLLVCLFELVYEGRRAKVTWRWCSGTIIIPWFYHRSTNKAFGTLTEMIGLACAITQCVLTTINYCFYRRSHVLPIKMAVMPLIFAFGLVCSKIKGKLNNEDQDGGQRNMTISDQDGHIALNQAIQVLEPLPPVDESQRQGRRV